MDFQNRAGGKTGGGGVASASDANRDRRERLRQLALETIDIAKDPYFMKNHLGSYECKLCLTLHNNEGSYLAHTQGKKHQSNLARRAAKEALDAPAQPAPEKVSENAEICVVALIVISNLLATHRRKEVIVTKKYLGLVQGKVSCQDSARLTDSLNDQ